MTSVHVAGLRGGQAGVKRGAYGCYMRRVCAYISGDPAIAEDATEAAWVVAWKRLHDVRSRVIFGPGSSPVAANEAKKLQRTRRRQARYEVATDASREPGGLDPATGVSGLDLRKAIARLDPDDRALPALRYVAGFDSNELAVATGKKPAAIRQGLKRLLDRLRENLTDG